MASGEFHTDKSRIVLHNNGAVITILVYSISFHIDFNTELFRGPTRSIDIYIHTYIQIYIHKSKASGKNTKTKWGGREGNL